MISSTTLNTLGLVLDIFGVLGIFKFGIPPKIDRKGAIFLILEQSDSDDASKAALYDTMSGLSLGLIVVGFGLQIWSNYII